MPVKKLSESVKEVMEFEDKDNVQMWINPQGEEKFVNVETGEVMSEAVNDPVLIKVECEVERYPVTVYIRESDYARAVAEGSDILSFQIGTLQAVVAEIKSHGGFAPWKPMTQSSGGNSGTASANEEGWKCPVHGTQKVGAWNGKMQCKVSSTSQEEWTQAKGSQYQGKTYYYCKHREN